ncbi:hypothetical protein [Engelhardtia mirabilis]|uniref:Uncharacterized protein n=1 Tax=Engelhardtia mirabilis TaxID=2528011 RepID=A0A518BQQ7_9BACT|nr:hypothetical protein Pla133_44320 [Planctomycetes bacterium Pla133]QDV03639.1 hypothetical protein Pla86_44300 [Planctomycetes bacterium Pla86]
MRGRRAFLGVAALAALVPLVARPGVPESAAVGDWPVELDGVALRPLPPSELDRTFAQSAPIEVARFEHDGAHLVLRRVPHATPKLHSLRECYRGSGRSVRPLQDVVRPGGERASAFEVTEMEQRLLVHEWIVDADGRVESDFQSWYWHASTSRLRPPFLAFARVERAD